MICKAYRFNDQMLCSCGIAWDINEPDPHTPQKDTPVQPQLAPCTDELPTSYRQASQPGQGCNRHSR